MERGIVRGRRAARRSQRSARGVTLVEVLIVVAIMAVIAGSAVFLVFPQLDKAKVKTAQQSAQTIRQAAEIHMNLDSAASDCPSIQDLVATKKLDRTRTDDPWGTPFKVVCEEGGELRVISAGKDKKEGTPDDVRDDMKPSEIEKIANM